MIDLRQQATFNDEDKEKVEAPGVVGEATDNEVVKVVVAVDLTDEQVAAWKAQWGKVFKTVVDGEPYIWRKLRRHEYVSAMSVEVEEGELAKNNIYYRQEHIANTITLYPADIKTRIAESAGLATAIADAAIAVAGFDVEATQEL